MIRFFIQIVSGPENCVLLVACATREKEGSNEDPLVDESEWQNKLKSVGFKQLAADGFQPLQVPAEE